MPATLSWSSRAGIRAQLRAVLDALPLESFETRGRALRLLRLFGSEEDLPLVRALLLDAREHLSVRAWALEVSIRLGLRLPAPEFSALLRESAPPATPEAPASGLDPHRCLQLVHGEEELAPAAAFLLQWTPWERTSLLLGRHPGGALPAPVVTWLYTRWRQEDEAALAREPGGPERNLRIAAATWTRPESWARLGQETRSLPPEALTQWLAEAVPGEALHHLWREDSEALHRAAEALVLPLPSLLACLGAEGLCHRLEQVLRAQSRSLRVAYGLVPPPEGYPRALEVLGAWPGARAVLLRHLCDFDVAPEVRLELLQRLWRSDRTTARRWALAALSWPDNLPLVRAVLREAAGSAHPEDRPLFLAVLSGTDEAARGFALEGLLALGETGPEWCERLESLSYAPHPGVRVRAMAGLLRQGRAEAGAWLERMADAADEPWVRAEALRWLGETDARAWAPLLVRGLVDDTWEKRLWARTDEAAWALFQWGSPEALGALLTTHLMGGLADIEGYLEVHLARQEGRPARELPVPRARAHVAHFIERPDSGG